MRCSLPLMQQHSKSLSRCPYGCRLRLFLFFILYRLYRPNSKTVGQERFRSLVYGRSWTIFQDRRLISCSAQPRSVNGPSWAIHSLRGRRLTAPSRCARRFSVQTRPIFRGKTCSRYGRSATIFQIHRPTASRHWARDGAGTAKSGPQKHFVNDFRGDTPPAHFSFKTFPKISTLFPLFLSFLKILSDLKIFSNFKNCKDFYIILEFSDFLFCLSSNQKGHKGA